MNAAQIHLALNHAPLFLSAIGGGLLLLGMIRKNSAFQNVSLYMLVAAAIFALPVYFTGEGTEELVEHLPGVNEAAIEKHEDLAKMSLIIIIVCGAASLAGLLFRKNAGFSKIAVTGALLLSLASFVTMAQTAHQGGLIRHSELNAGAAAGENGEGKEDKEENEENEKSAGTDTSKTTIPVSATTDQDEGGKQKGKDKKDDDD